MRWIVEGASEGDGACVLMELLQEKPFVTPTHSLSDWTEYERTIYASGAAGAGIRRLQCLLFSQSLVFPPVLNSDQELRCILDSATFFTRMGAFFTSTVQHHTGLWEAFLLHHLI